MIPKIRTQLYTILEAGMAVCCLLFAVIFSRHSFQLVLFCLSFPHHFLFLCLCLSLSLTSHGPHYISFSPRYITCRLSRFLQF